MSKEAQALITSCDILKERMYVILKKPLFKRAVIQILLL